MRYGRNRPQSNVKQVKGRIKSIAYIQKSDRKHRRDRDNEILNERVICIAVTIERFKIKTTYYTENENYATLLLGALKENMYLELDILVHPDGEEEIVGWRAAD